jgi:hypothetical protein
MAAMPTNAAKGRVTPDAGNKRNTTLPNIAPVAPPMVSNGASVPPEVPLPNAITQERNLRMHNDKMS